MKINIDFETFSECSLKDSGAWVYSQHPSTRVLCMAYSVDGGPPELWIEGQGLPVFMRTQGCVEFHAWNSFFEMCIMFNALPDCAPPWIPRWTDTMALAAAQALPMGLETCCKVLGLPADQAKGKRGRYLIQRLCKPHKLNRDPKLLQELYDYCKQDVVAEMAVAKKLRPLSEQERKIWELDQKINFTGIPVDIDFISKAAELVEKISVRQNCELKRITGEKIKSANQVAVIKAFLAEHYGLNFPALDVAAVAETLERSDLDPVARRILEIRASVGRSSNAKFKKLIQTTGTDGRAHGTAIYHGAATGRWAGRKVQPHNMPRPTIPQAEIDSVIHIVKKGNGEILSILYEDPLEILSSTIRGSIAAPEGKHFKVCDFASIEARVLALLAGQQDKLKIFRGDGKVYEHTAAKIFGVAVAEVTQDQRLVGKVAELALGFQGALGAFQKMSKTYGLSLPDETVKKVVNDWRGVNLRIVAFWYDVQDAALQAVYHPGTVQKCRGVSFKIIGNFLYCRLPSGRSLSYFRPRIGENQWGQPQIQYQGKNSVTHQWVILDTYGGKLVENITQAFARDILAEAMLRLDKAGFDIVLTIHDEIISEEFDNSERTLDDMSRIMCEVPTWARGLPIAASGYESQRYRKG